MVNQRLVLICCFTFVPGVSSTTEPQECEKANKAYDQAILKNSQEKIDEAQKAFASALFISNGNLRSEDFFKACPEARLWQLSAANVYLKNVPDWETRVSLKPDELHLLQDAKKLYESLFLFTDTHKLTKSQKDKLKKRSKAYPEKTNQKLGEERLEKLKQKLKDPAPDSAAPAEEDQGEKEEGEDGGGDEEKYEEEQLEDTQVAAQAADEVAAQAAATEAADKAAAEKAGKTGDWKVASDAAQKAAAQKAAAQKAAAQKAAAEKAASDKEKARVEKEKKDRLGSITEEGSGNLADEEESEDDGEEESEDDDDDEASSLALWADAKAEEDKETAATKAANEKTEAEAKEKEKQTAEAAIQKEAADKKAAEEKTAAAKAANEQKEGEADDSDEEEPDGPDEELDVAEEKLAKEKLAKEKQAAKKEPKGGETAEESRAVVIYDKNEKEGKACNCGVGLLAANVCCGDGLICSSTTHTCKKAAGKDQSPASRKVAMAAIFLSVAVTMMTLCAILGLATGRMQRSSPTYKQPPTSEIELMSG